MNMLAEAKRSAYATIGAADGALGKLQQWWAEPRQTWQDAVSAYDRIAERGRDLVERRERQTKQGAREAARTARRVPGVAPVEGELTGAAATTAELPLADYDNRNATDIAAELAPLSQRQLHQIEGYELANRQRRTVLNKVEELRGTEPWPGYDELTVDEIVPEARQLTKAARDELIVYEQRHRNRRTILEAAGA